jgi:hypothetical protein
VRAGGRFLNSKQYRPALRHLLVAARFGSPRQRFQVLKVIGSVAWSRVSGVLSRERSLLLRRSRPSHSG